MIGMKVIINQIHLLRGFLDHKYQQSVEDMSQIQVDTIVDKAGTGSPAFTYGLEVPVGYGITGAGGINVSGVVTCGSLAGSATG